MQAQNDHNNLPLKVSLMSLLFEYYSVSFCECRMNSPIYDIVSKRG